MTKLIIIYFDWATTTGNHAGMAYFVKKIQEAYPQSVEIIEIPKVFQKWNLIKKKLYHLHLIFQLKKKLSENDKVLFMEYLGGNSGDQTQLAILLRRFKLNFKIYGMVHLPGSKLLQYHRVKTKIIKGASAVDKLIVMGTSLKHFFSELGFADKVVFVTHYVDNEYYKPGSNRAFNQKLKILAIGNTLRNFEQLVEIIQRLNEAEFHICGLKSDIVKNKIKKLKNTFVYDFFSEDELLNLMQQSDVSLSVMYDTIGSNVIVTSLATGLPQVVSDVGSIRDYCDESNTVFCNSTDEFISAIEHLSLNRQLLKPMIESALKKSKEFALSEIINSFEKNILNA